MGDLNTTGEAALVRAVRALDQGDFDTIPDRLERVWDTLSDYRGGNFHAAEEMLLRWLLKNMAGTSENAERVRRYTRAWDILSAVFALIPLFSLAKSLADRRFVSILQQTLKDLASPQKQKQQQPPQEGARAGEADSDVEMVDAPPLDSSPSNPRKRKRAASASFDLAVQRQTAACLQTAEAVFEAIRVLLSRCELKSLDSPTTHRMGAEHVKSLFSSSAAETMEILVPWLTICGFALEQPTVEPPRQQSSWLSTFSALWELHLQSAGDAVEVATHLSGRATRLLGRVAGIPRQTSLGIDTAVQERWSRDLCRFLTRNLILPARAAFLTRESREVVDIAVDVSRASAQIAFPVLFDLVVRLPVEFGGKASRKDYETWVQVVFDSILHAAKSANRDKSLAAVRTILEMAAERGTALSIDSLRTVCKGYALQPDAHDWSLLLSIVKLNPDVFLLSDDGKQLLDQVLEKTLEPASLSPEDFERASQFVVLLARGYAQGRDLSTFFRVWLKHLVPARRKAGLQPLWAQKELADTVARLIQSSLNTNQLADVLEWLSSQTQPAESMARIHILDAISNGISQEDFIDTANMKTFDGVFLDKFSKKELPAISVCRWMVAAKTIARGTLEEASRVWSQIKPDLKSILRKFPVDREDTFAAFRCCVAAWLANHPGAAHEDDAATLICAFVERLEQDPESMEVDSHTTSESSLSVQTYVTWILSEAPRLLSLLLERKGHMPDVILSHLALAGAEKAVAFDSALSLSRVLLERESPINSQRLMDLLIDTAISQIDTSKAGRSGALTKIAIQFLLDVPPEALSRGQREAAMKSLVAHLPGDSDKAESIGTEYWKPVLSLMIKLMERPTFYEGMSFSHLNAIGRCVLRIHKRSNRRSRGELATDDISRGRDIFTLLQHLAVLTLRPCEDADVVLRIILLQAVISAVQESPALKKIEGHGLDLGRLKDSLLQIATPVITSGKRKGKDLFALLIALEAMSCLDRGTVKQAVSSATSSLREASDALLDNGVQAGWQIRMFLANHFPEALASPLKVNMSYERAASAEEDGGPDESTSEISLGKTALLRYVDAVVQAVDEDTKLGYLKELLAEDDESQSEMGRLLVIYRLIQHLKGSRPSDTPDRFDLAQAHTALCNRLLRTTTPSHFLLISKAIHHLLDQNAICMTQWNIELTLSSVSAISARASTQSLVSASPNTYHSLCRLVEMVIKRHRKRLDGHFHILITALQSLLRLLLSRPHGDDDDGNANPEPTGAAVLPAAETGQEPSRRSAMGVWERHAKRFARLLTLVCEPTVGSVTRSQARSALDSEKDRAKRYAGQHMYLVLMQYVRLQLEHAVPHGVREALEPGVYSVMDVTTQDTLRVMNDGMDPSGRVIFKEMYKQYQKFGKWTGV